MKELLNSTGFFKEQYRKFRQSAPNNVHGEFARQKTDLERWKFVEKLNKIEFPVKAPDAKDVKTAISLKTDGNKLFQQGNNFEAFSLYSQSLLVYPSDGDKVELSIIRANRSAALYHLEEYEAALSDIEIALSSGYPKHLHHKIIDRKAKCLMALKQNRTAVQALKESLTTLDDAKIPEDVLLKKQQDIQILLGIMDKNKVIDEPRKADTIDNTIRGEKNPKYKAAVKSVSFSFSEVEGRFAQAEANIQSGDVILRERAHCAVLLQENAKTHCFQCLKRVYFLEPCPDCSTVRFCSRKCQETASKTHHKYECGILNTLWGSGASITCLMAIRILTQKPLRHFLKIADQLEENQSKLPTQEYSGSNYSTVYNLVRHEDKRSSEDMLHRTYMALFLHDCLTKSGYFKDPDVNENELQTGREMAAVLLLRHLQSLQFNAHEVSELVIHTNDPQNWKSIFVGGGLFPTLALFNHSCEPSIIRYFEGTSVVVRAIKNIKAGEPIYENYGPIFTREPKSGRLTTLKTQYWFDCQCEPCTRNWPLLDLIDTSVMRFYCDNAQCDNVVVVPVNTTNFMAQCNKCNGSTNILKGLKVLQDTETLFRLGESYLKTGEVFKALKKFLELQHLLSDTLAPPFRDYYICQQNVRNCIMAMGNTHPPLKKIILKNKSKVTLNTA